MLKLIKHLYKRNAILLALVFTVTIVFLSLVKLESSPVGFSHSDKVKHAIAYGVLTFTWLVAFVKKKFKNVVIVCCFLLGILMEYLQGTITDYRTAEFADVIANSVGVIVAVLIFNFLVKKNKSNTL